MSDRLGLGAGDGDSFRPPPRRFEPEGLVSGPAGLRRLLGGLEVGSACRGCFLGGVIDLCFTGLLWGEREEELPEDDRERERRLRTGERLRLCLGGGGRRGGLLRLGDMRLRGLGLRRGE